MQEQLTARKRARIYAAVLTPITREGSPDLALMTDFYKSLLDCRVDGIAPLGTTGEANSLSIVQRIRLTETVAQHFGARQVIIGTGSCALADAVLLTRVAVAAGLTNVLVLPPFYYKNVTDDGLVAFFSELIERVSSTRLKVFLYNFPAQSGITISPYILQRLVDCFPSVIAGLKDSSGDPEYLNLICKKSTGLQIFAGMEHLLLHCLNRGGAGCISALANVAGSLCADVVEQWSCGAGADQAQAALTALFRATATAPIVPVLKEAMYRRTGENRWRNLLPPLSHPLEHTLAEIFKTKAGSRLLRV